MYPRNPYTPTKFTEDHPVLAFLTFLFFWPALCGVIWLLGALQGM